MYREEIMDHAKRPRNSGKLEGEVQSLGKNPSCGDEIKVYLRIEDGIIKNIKHETDGCAISTASASILSEELQDMKLKEVEKLDREWIKEVLGMDLSPMRIKCGILPLKTVQDAIEEKED